ncbi:MAG: NAD+ synthase, partial [Candidatus Binatia bacterium]
MIPANTALLRRILVAFLRDEVRKVGIERAVLGLSGGVDS